MNELEKEEEEEEMNERKRALCVLKMDQRFSFNELVLTEWGWDLVR